MNNTITVESIKAQIIGGIITAFVIACLLGNLLMIIECILHTVEPDDLSGVSRWCYDQGARSESALRDCIWDLGHVYAAAHPEVPRGR